MTTAAYPRVHLLVCGNVDRRDDGAALWAVSHLLAGMGELIAPELTVIQCGQLNIDDLVGLDGPALIVDTAIGVAPGDVVTLDFDDLLRHPKAAAPHSSHALPIDQVIGVARNLSDRPIDGLFVGIGAADVGYGAGLSTPVRESMGKFVMEIERALVRLFSNSMATVAG